MVATCALPALAPAPARAQCQNKDTSCGGDPSKPSKAICAHWAATPLPPAVVGQEYSTELYTLPKSKSPAVLSSVPPGLQARLDQASGTLYGTPTQKGQFALHLQVSGLGSACLALDTVTLALTVGDAKSVAHNEPPRLVSFTVTPETLPSNGGQVTATIQATDAVGVKSAYVTLTQPDGHVGGGSMSLTSGTAANGTWTLSWSNAGNSSATPALYTLTARVTDQQGNTLNVAAKTYTVSGYSSTRARPTKR